MLRGIIGASQGGKSLRVRKPQSPPGHAFKIEQSIVWNRAQGISRRAGQSFQLHKSPTVITAGEDLPSQHSNAAATHPPIHSAGPAHKELNGYFRVEIANTDDANSGVSHLVQKPQCKCSRSNSRDCLTRYQLRIGPQAHPAFPLIGDATVDPAIGHAQYLHEE